MTKQKEYWQMQPEEVMELIDPNLRFIKKFAYQGISLTCLVESEQGLSVVKAGPFCSNHVEREKKALKTLAGTKGIPEFYNHYKRKNILQAILKEYIPGKSFSGFDDEKSLVYKEPKIQEKTEKLYEDMIEKGVIILDDHIMNFIFHQIQQQPYLIDFGCAIFNDATTFNFVERAKTFYKYGQKNYFPDI